MANPGDFAYTVKQQADIVRIIGDYIKLKKAGAQNYAGLCPFHGEKTPRSRCMPRASSITASAAACPGDVFSFVQKIENITFPESVRLVAQKLGIPLPKASVFDSGRSQRSAPPRPVARRARARRRIFSGMPAPSRRRPRPRISGRPRPRRGDDREIPHRLRPRFRLPAPRPPEKRIQRRSPPRKRPVLVEARGRASERQPSGVSKSTETDRCPVDVRPFLDGQGGDSDSDAEDGSRRSRRQTPEADARRRHVLQIPQPRHVPHRERSRQSHRLHRTHPRHRRKSRPEISELARDRDLFQGQSPLQSRSRQRVDARSSTTPSWSKARWTASPSTPPDFTT